MGPGYQSSESLPIESRVWRISGLARDGRVISHEFAGPHCGSGSVAFQEMWLLGRDPGSCDFSIDHPTVSRVHAEIRFVVNQGLQIRDRGSRNGTFVNDERVYDDFVTLDVGCDLRLGDLPLSVSYPR